MSDPVEAEMQSDQEQPSLRYLTKCMLKQKGFLCILLSFLSTFAVSFLSLSQVSLSPLFFYMIFMAIGLAVIKCICAAQKRADLYRLFLIIYTINVIVVLFFYYSFQGQTGYPYLPGESDDTLFDYCGKYAAESLKVTGAVSIPAMPSAEGLSEFRFEKYSGYITVLAYLYCIADLLGDMHTMIPRLFNSLLIGLLSVTSVILAMRSGLHRRPALYAGFAIGLYPSISFWGAVIVRDVLDVFLLLAAVAALHGAHYSSRKRILSFIVFSMAVSGLIAIRYELGLIALLLSGFYVLAATAVKPGLVFKLIPAAVLGTLLVFLHPFLKEKLALIITIADVQSEYRLGLSDGLSQTIFSLPLFPNGVILRPLYALVSPFPSLSLDPRYLYEGIGTVLVMILLPFVGVGFFRSLSARRSMIVGVFFVGTLLAISWISFQPRHMLAYMPFLFILSAYGADTRYRRTVVLYTLPSLVGLAVVYFYLKGM